MRYLIILLAASLIIGLGCSNGAQHPILPDLPNRDLSTKSPHHTWGLWQFTANPEAGTLDMVQLRTGNFHLNALPFLEPPPLVNLTLESLEFNGNIIDADIGLRHPFLGLTEFTGFDVCGILISNGEVTGFDDPDIHLAGDGDLRLLNPDGLSRWWNPAEFPINNGTIFSYTDGLLGAPDSFADYNSTLNAYKYFCDDLEPDAPLGNVTLANRGMFSAGKKNIRHYTIDLGEAGLIFNYAVDACWEFPDGGYPWQAPDDFAPEANRPEAWRTDVTITNNSLWNDGLGGSGGDLSLSIDVYDWYNAGLNIVTADSPGNFTATTSSTPVGGGEGYSTYEIDITGATPAQGSIDVLIEVECEVIDYGDLLPGEAITAYFMYAVSVGSGIPVEVDPYYDGIYPAGSADDPLPTEWGKEFNGSEHPGSSHEWDFSYDGVNFNIEAGGQSVAHEYSYESAEDYPITYDVALRVDGVGGDIYIYPTVVARGVYVDGSTGSSGASGAMADPLDTIVNGVLEAESEADDVDGSIIMIRGDDGAGVQLVYNERVDLTSTHAGIGLQGYSLDTEHYKIPAMRDFRPPGRDVGASWDMSECIYGDSVDGVRVDGFEFESIRGPEHGNQAHWQEWVRIIHFENSNNVRISHTYMHNMHAENDWQGWKSGYCIYLSNCNDAVVKNNLFYDGLLATDWGGMHWFMAFVGSDLHLANNTVDKIDESSWSSCWWIGYARGIYLRNTTSAVVTNTIISDLTGALWDYEPFDKTVAQGILGSGNTNPNVDYCDVWDIQKGYGHPPNVNYYYDHRFYGDITEGANCVNPGGNDAGSDPIYVDGHHLDTGSPCIDVGDPGIEDYDGTPSDIGCYGGPGGDWNFED